MTLNRYDMNQLDLDIYPGIGLGGFKLGDPLPMDTEGLTASNDFDGETTYTIENGSLCFAISKRTLRIFRISALSGYPGKLNSHIYTGMEISNLLTEFSGWRYSEEQSGFHHEDYIGVMIAPDLEDATEEEAMSCTIGEIAVYDERFY